MRNITPSTTTAVREIAASTPPKSMMIAPAYTSRRLISLRGHTAYFAR